MSTIKYYTHSGKAPLPGFFTALGLGGLLAIVLAFLYNFLIIVIPIVYLNFFITLGFGLVLGYSMKFLSRFGKVRNQKKSLLLAGLIGFVGFYFQWIAYFVFLDSGQHSFGAYQEGFRYFYDPTFFVYLVIELNKVGSWSMFGIQFTDFPLWVIWTLEAGMIIGTPILIALKHPIVPYSEMLDQWYRKFILDYEFESIAGQNQFRKSLEEDVERTINTLQYGQPYRFARIAVYFLEGEDTQYLSVDNVFIEDRGKGKESITPVVHLVGIDTKTAQRIMEKHGSKKQFKVDY